MLQLPYPGGKHLENLACSGDENKIRFPRAYLPGSFDFSFSGLKTSVFYYITKNGLKDAPDIAAGFQRSVADVIVKKVSAASMKYPVKSFLFGGGVMQNKYIRGRLQKHFEKSGIEFFIPENRLCMDNGAISAVLTYFLIKSGTRPSPYSISVVPTGT